MATPNQDDDTQPDAEGADLAAQFFKMAQAKGISLESSDYLDEDDDDEDEEKDDDEEEPNIPQGKIYIFFQWNEFIQHPTTTDQIENAASTLCPKCIQALSTLSLAMIPVKLAKS